MPKKEPIYRLTREDVTFVHKLRNEGVPMYFTVQVVFGWSYENYSDRLKTLIKQEEENKHANLFK